MNKKILQYAEKHINMTAQENGLKANISNNSIYLETTSGKNYKLADEEIKHQALEFLNSEIEEINSN